jgi:hypothetical protein
MEIKKKYNSFQTTKILFFVFNTLCLFRFVLFKKFYEAIIFDYYFYLSYSSSYTTSFDSSDLAFAFIS